MLVVMWNCNSGNMTKRNLFINIVFLLIAILFSAISPCSSALSNERLCYDAECSVPVSLARTSLKYSPNEAGLLPFDINVEVKVYSKEAGSRTDLWGVEINGKRGYAPKSFLKEHKILHKDLRFKVPITQLPNNNNKSDKILQPKVDNVKLNSVKDDTNSVKDNPNIKNTEELPRNVINATPSYEIIDGTTLHLDGNESPIQPTVKTETVQATVVPNKKDVINTLTKSSDSEKVETIFAEGIKLPKQILNNEINDRETIPQKADIKNFVTSSEEILDLPHITGVQVPLKPLETNTNINGNIHSEEKTTIQKIETNTTTEVKNVESLKKLNEINVLEIPVSNNGKEIINKDTLKDTAVNEFNKNDNGKSNEGIISKDIKVNIETTQNVVPLKDTAKINWLGNATSLKTEQIKLKEDIKTPENKLTNPDTEAKDITKETFNLSIQGVVGETNSKPTSEEPNHTTFPSFPIKNNLPNQSDSKKDQKSTTTATASTTSQSTDQKFKENISDGGGNKADGKISIDAAKVSIISQGKDLNLKEDSNAKSNIKESGNYKDEGKIPLVTTTTASATQNTVQNLKESGNANIVGKDGGYKDEDKPAFNKAPALAISQGTDLNLKEDSNAKSNIKEGGDYKDEGKIPLDTTKTASATQNIVQNLKESGNANIVGKDGGYKDEDKPAFNKAPALPISQGTDLNLKEDSNAKSNIKEDGGHKDEGKIPLDTTTTASATQNIVQNLKETGNANIVIGKDAGYKDEDKPAFNKALGSSISQSTDLNLKESGNANIVNDNDGGYKNEGKLAFDKAPASTTSEGTDMNHKENGNANVVTGKNSDSKDEGKQFFDTTASPSPHDTDRNLKESSNVNIVTTTSTTPQNTHQNFKESNSVNVIAREEDGSKSGDKISSDNATASATFQDIKDNILKNDIDIHVKNETDDSRFIVSRELNAPHLPEGKESTPDLPASQYTNEKSMVFKNIASINEFRNRNLLDADDQIESVESVGLDEVEQFKDEALYETEGGTMVQDKNLYERSDNEDTVVKYDMLDNILHDVKVSPPDVCAADNTDCSIEDNINENAVIEGIKIETSYWLTLMYLTITVTATLIFSLGFYYIENMRRDQQLIAKINKLEKDLLISTKECTMMSENLKLTTDKLTSIEDESFGSNEMVSSLKADLEALRNSKAELEDHVAMLEKDLESATEAGLELERMLREVLSSDNEVNPLAQSVENLQTRLNAQQAANESLTNALNLKTQELEFDKLENESLSAELTSFKKKYEELEVELVRVTDNLTLQVNNKKSVEQTLTDKVQQLEMQTKEISVEKVALQKELKAKEIETKDLLDVINRLNSNNLDLDKLYDVSRIKAEATALLEERNELKIQLTEIEGAHSLLEEHVKVIKEEVATLSKQCKVAEKVKKDAETRLEVLSNFFQEKEAQRQKEEAVWLQQQGEVLSTVERIQMMQNEIQNYKQQIEMLKHEILDQEREYKNQISVLETKAHEQWVIARQVERRLEESKVEAGQLRNRLTLIEKNINEADSEAKLHRLEANGETATSSSLFIGAESSNSPIMFSGSSNVPPPPPPSYLHSLFPPYLPPPLPSGSGVPPYEVSQRPPPLGGRLSSPPPMPLHPPASSRYDTAGSPPPMSPHLLPPFNHRSPPPPFGSDHIHPPPPPSGSILPRPLGTMHSWGDESLPPPRNSGFHPSQRDRVRNHKGSLHSSGESLDKTHHNSKV
ncbi:LOW QUALITY PROTEIN: transport and Golgi organization protein 1 [Hylaeus volcanicus]|uniref:LOW QUALITY PROTEIN: transport and Golgi organization protein 1 n=1 Tax=Hylaeus volcanicus TaxID=313075 RepID=UPI0023B7EDA5|nr:LOW QUALITY PROTEIN: transport and Golgi organization protein 1 [Hylaeus volcanicus]